ncbi:MAG: N-acetylmuramoyl-L-alanine amidase [Micavibrio sp.]
MRRKLSIPLFILLLLLTLGGGANAALALDVTGIRLGTHPDKTRLVIEMNAPSAFRTFMLADPVRLVVDLPGFDWRVGAIGKPKGTGIRDIRQGPLQPGISRIVIDLERPSLIRTAFLIPRSHGQPDRIVIDFSAAKSIHFVQGRGKIFGTLRVDDPVPVATMTSAQSSAIAGNLTAPEPKPAPKSTIPASQRPLIVLDPGHGGEDPGALGAHNLKEKNITLAMAKDLKKYLEETGRYRVILTRDKDVFIRLSQRVAFARSKKADLFISLHADSINRSGVRGASIYTLSEKASDAETEKLAARENHADMIAGLDLSVEDEDVANILVDLAMRDTMNQSKFFANKTVAMLKTSGVRVLENPHRYAGFAVLKAPDIPSILLEMGYMSNNQESALLSSPEYRAKIAEAVVSGIDNYFETVRH